MFYQDDYYSPLDLLFSTNQFQKDNLRTDKDNVVIVKDKKVSDVPALRFTLNTNSGNLINYTNL